MEDGTDDKLKESFSLLLALDSNTRYSSRPCPGTNLTRVLVILQFHPGF